jgi:hypothetical protein
MVGIAFGNSGAPAQYQSDLAVLEAALKVVEADCSQVGVPMSVHLRSQ